MSSPETEFLKHFDGDLLAAVESDPEAAQEKLHQLIKSGQFSIDLVVEYLAATVLNETHGTGGYSRDYLTSVIANGLRFADPEGFNDWVASQRHAWLRVSRQRPFKVSSENESDAEIDGPGPGAVTRYMPSPFANFLKWAAIVEACLLTSLYIVTPIDADGLLMAGLFALLPIAWIWYVYPGNELIAQKRRHSR
jgi:hypothetical protein